MKLTCKYCKTYMDPKIEVDKRIITTDQETYYCSKCGKQLIVTGGSFADKPVWKQPGYIGAWLPHSLYTLLQLWEMFKTALKEKNQRNVISFIVFFIIVAISLAVGLIFYFFNL